MRGKASDQYIFQFLNRITPAYAGKRLCTVAVFSRKQDHPRLCGEKLDTDHAIF